MMELCEKDCRKGNGEFPAAQRELYCDGDQEIAFNAWAGAKPEIVMFATNPESSYTACELKISPEDARTLAKALMKAADFAEGK